jgi:hypothetical protein
MKKALLIGINYFNNPMSLKGCINDTVNMKTLLVSQLGYSADNITTLRDDSKVSTEQPTRANILKELKKLINSPNCAEIWVCYSGHGTHVRNTTHNKINNVDQVIVPVDYLSSGFILDREINDIVETAKCRAILIFDSCRSGTVCDLPWVYEFKSPTSYTRRSENNDKINNKHIYMFSGCKDTQTSADAYNGESKEYTGAFTSAFIDSMKVAPTSINLLILYRNICMLLKKRNFIQMPCLSSSSDVPSMMISKASTLLTSGSRYMTNLINVGTKMNTVANPVANHVLNMNPVANPVLNMNKKIQYLPMR